MCRPIAVECRCSKLARGCRLYRTACDIKVTKIDLSYALSKMFMIWQQEDCVLLCLNPIAIKERPLGRYQTQASGSICPFEGGMHLVMVGMVPICFLYGSASIQQQLYDFMGLAVGSIITNRPMF